MNLGEMPQLAARLQWVQRIVVAQGLEHVRETIAFPRMLYRLRP